MCHRVPLQITTSVNSFDHTVRKGLLSYDRIVVLAILTDHRLRVGTDYEIIIIINRRVRLVDVWGRVVETFRILYTWAFRQSRREHNFSIHTFDMTVYFVRKRSFREDRRIFSLTWEDCDRRDTKASDVRRDGDDDRVWRGGGLDSCAVGVTTGNHTDIYLSYLWPLVLKRQINNGPPAILSGGHHRVCGQQEDH